MDLSQVLSGKSVVENWPFDINPVKDGAIAAKPLVAKSADRTVACDASGPRLSVQSRGGSAKICARHVGDETYAARKSSRSKWTLGVNGCKSAPRGKPRTAATPN